MSINKKALRVIISIIGILATVFAIIDTVAYVLASGCNLYAMVRYSLYIDTFMTPFIIATMYAMMFGYLSYLGTVKFILRR